MPKYISKITFSQNYTSCKHFKFLFYNIYKLHNSYFVYFVYFVILMLLYILYMYICMYIIVYTLLYNIYYVFSTHPIDKITSRIQYAQTQPIHAGKFKIIKPTSAPCASG